MKDVVIVGALRTPIGCFRGALAGHSAVELAALVVKALIERTGVPAYAVDEVILGQVLTAGQGRIRQGNRLLKVVFLIAFLQSLLMTFVVPGLKHCIWLLRRYSVARLILSSPVAGKHEPRTTCSD